MRAYRVGTFLFLIAFLAAGFDPALAVTTEAAGEPAPETTAAPAVALPQTRSLEMQEITAVLDAERQQVQELTAVLKEVNDDSAELALVRRIEQIKMGAEISVLRIQAKYAVNAGFTEKARQIEEALTELQTTLDATAATLPSTNGR